MSAILNDLGTYLEAQIGELVKGKTLFRDRFPPTLQNACFIEESESTLSGSGNREYYKSVDGPVYMTRTSLLKVYVRKLRKLEAENLSGQITALLTNLDTNVLTNFILNAIRYSSGPTFFQEAQIINGSRVYTFLSLFSLYYEDKDSTLIA